MAVFGGSFIGLMLLPVDFPYWAFAVLIAANGIGSGMFAAPNSSSIMGSVPAAQRGAASGMRSTFQNSGTAALPAAARQTITGREFFPDLISGPFQHGLVVVFVLATVLTVLAALASALRGGRHVPPPDSTRPPDSAQHPETP